MLVKSNEILGQTKQAAHAQPFFLFLQPVRAGQVVERVITTRTALVSTKTEGHYQLEKFAYDPYRLGKAYKTKQVMGFIEQPWYRQLLTSGDLQVCLVLPPAPDLTCPASVFSPPVPDVIFLSSGNLQVCLSCLMFPTSSSQLQLGDLN